LQGVRGTSIQFIAASTTCCCVAQAAPEPQFSTHEMGLRALLNLWGGAMVIQGERGGLDRIFCAAQGEL